MVKTKNMRPIILILTCFASGVLLQAYFNGPLNETALFILFAVSLASAALLSLKASAYARKLTYPCFFLLGALFILPSLNTANGPEDIASLVHIK